MPVILVPGSPISLIVICCLPAFQCLTSVLKFPIVAISSELGLLLIIATMAWAMKKTTKRPSEKIQILSG